MKKGFITPSIDFTDIVSGDISVGSFLFGFDINNANKLSKMDSSLALTVIEGAGGGGGGSFPTSKVIYVDATYGNDLTGAYEDPSKPFLSIAAAEAFANSGDSLDIRAGTYNDAFLGKDGINYYYRYGAILNSSGYCYFDSSDMSYNVFGYGKFNGSTMVLAINNINTVVNFNCLSASGNGCFDIENGIANISCIGDAIANNQPCLRTGNNAPNFPTVIIRAKNMTSNRVVVFNSDHLDPSPLSGVVKIYADKLKITTGGSPYAIIAIECQVCDIYADLSNDSATSVGCIDTFGGILNIHGNSNFTKGTSVFVRTSTASLNFYGEVYSEGTIINLAGNLQFRNKVISNIVATSTIDHRGGKTVIHDLVKNIDNDVASDGIYVSADGLILRQGASIFTQESTKCVNSAGSQTIKSYPGSVANNPVGASITQAVSALLIDSLIDSE